MTLPKDPIKAAAYRESIRQRRLGSKHTEETLKKFREGRSGEKNPNFGKVMSDEQREKIRLAKLGKPQSETQKKNRSIALKKFYEDHPGAKDEKRTHLIKFNDGREYTEDYRKKLSLAKQGENHPNFGKHLSEETREKIRVANSGENCYAYGKPQSEESRRKKSEAQRGDKCYNWKGGITALNHLVRNSLENRDWIMAVFKRDAFTCQDCGATKVYLHAHHIKPFAEIMRENNITTIEEARACAALWNVANGKSLCEECHREEHFGEVEEVDVVAQGVIV